MKYCAQCGSEFLDSVAVCSDCHSQQFLDQPEPPLTEFHPVASDSERFALLVTVDDPLTASRYRSVLESARIPVTVREQQGGTVNRITDGVLPFWEVSVPQNALQKAAGLLRDAQGRIENETEDAARAAEEEAMSAQ